MIGTKSYGLGIESTLDLNHQHHHFIFWLVGGTGIEPVTSAV